MTDTESVPVPVVCFANAQLPDSDYRVSFARRSKRCEVTLALPAKPAIMPTANFERIDVGAGLSWRSVRQMMRIPEILSRRDAQVAIFFATQFTAFGPTMARMVGVTPIITITGMGRAFNSDSFKMRVARCLYIALFIFNGHLCKAILFQNDSDLEKLARYLPRRVMTRCRLIGSGIELELFEDETRYEDASSHRVLMVSRLLPEKGVEDFLQIAEALKDRATFVLIGPSSADHPDLAQSVRDAHTSGVVEYRGHLSSTDVRDELWRAAALVLPSYSEGLPRVALEAALTATAVVAYDIPGCRTALGPDQPLAALRDVRALQADLVGLLESSEVRLRRVQTARDFVTKEHSAEAYTTRLENVIL